ncbi:helix-turn-helix domain-containing protein [Marinobacter salicampi]|uniref:helix-turn-helix domain-containing protein n=1 Tax=Marinobacter salicampi TaxID=435907 RepID=UPI0014088BB9|nr:helix-turn-helix domain-containing protein [Marinobacter salicampi]
MGLGSALRQLRKSKGITLAELADGAGSHVGNLSRIERGAAKPSLNLLYRLAESLDFSLAEIFSAADQRAHDDKQVILNSLFIALYDEDRELLVDFAKLLQERASRDMSDIMVEHQSMPADEDEDEDEAKDKGQRTKDKGQRTKDASRAEDTIGQAETK